MDEKNMDISTIGDMLYPNLLRVRNRLKSEGLLENLQHVDTTNYKWDTDTITLMILKKTNEALSMSDYYQLKSLYKDISSVVVEKKYEIKATENDMVLQSGNTKIYYPLGELIFLNNRWSLFTRPNVDYRTSSN